MIREPRLRLEAPHQKDSVPVRVQEDIVQAMAEGQTIKHEVYGLGVVTASDGERTSVDFDDHGAKLFVTSIMTAELIGEAPATPPKTKRRPRLRPPRKLPRRPLPPLPLVPKP